MRWTTERRQQTTLNHSTERQPWRWIALPRPAGGARVNRITDGRRTRPSIARGNRPGGGAGSRITPARHRRGTGAGAKTSTASSPADSSAAAIHRVCCTITKSTPRISTFGSNPRLARNLISLAHRRDGTSKGPFFPVGSHPLTQSARDTPGNQAKACQTQPMMIRSPPPPDKTKLNCLSRVRCGPWPDATAAGWRTGIRPSPQ